MEPVRTPSQSVVIFIFLMITIFNFNHEENSPTLVYTELYNDPNEWVEKTASYHQSHPQQKKVPTADTLYHRMSYQEEKKLRSKFTNLWNPVSFTRSNRGNFKMK